MKALSRRALSGPIVGVRRRIELWRKTRPKRGPMPEDLWREAVALAQAHGVCAVARALRLDYYSLKRRAGGFEPPARPTEVAGFVEVSVCGSVVPTECVVEMERADGAKMRVRLSGQEQLLALSDSFWRGAP